MFKKKALNNGETAVKKTPRSLSYQTKRLAYIMLAVYAVLAVGFYFLAIYGNPQNEPTIFGKYYWAFAGGIFALLIGYVIYTVYCANKNKKCLCLRVTDIYLKYNFLLGQLVTRDFKSKYKRSVLGVLWSFLNPLLMMAVQYVVFSTIFGNASIEYYAVFLICGVVVFNFFSEASNMGIGAIVGNASLITKVYVPKYIYPVSRVISSTINLGFSLIPLLLIMMISGLFPTLYHLLLIIDLVLLVAFCMGLALFLSSVMVFFRDMQFLWSVLLTIWMYATPIFYSLDMFAANPTLCTLLKLNPLYHYVTFARTVLIDNCSPSLMSYVYCIACSVLMLGIGAFTFKKTQNKFVLYI